MTEKPDFFTVDDIATLWGLDTEDATTAVFDELSRIGVAPPRQHPSGARVMGLTATNFEKASALRFDNPPKAAPPPARRPVTAAEFSKIKSNAVGHGFKDLQIIGQAWGMPASKVLEHLHYLDQTIKDCVRLVPDGIEGGGIPQSERCGLYTEEFDRLTADRR